jgi:hypothetical protein
MRMKVGCWVLVVAGVLLQALVLPGWTAGEDGEDPPPPAPPAPPEGAVHPLQATVDRLLQSQADTLAVLGPVKSQTDLVQVIDLLRGTVHRREAQWLDGPSPSSWGTPRHAAPASLSSPSAIQVEVWVGRLPLAGPLAPRLAPRDMSSPRLERIAVPLEEVLGAARDAGAPHWRVGQATLRAGEEWRVSVGATRSLVEASRNAQGEGVVQAWDVFEGLRLAVSAEAPADQASSYSLAVRGECGGLLDPGAIVEAAAGGLAQASDAQYRSLSATRVAVGSEPRAWAARFVSPRFAAIDVVLTGRVVGE